MGEVVLGQDGEYRHHGEVVFLYPDLVTALAGQWVEGRLARGRQVRVAGLRWAGGVAQLVTRPAPGAAVLSYQPSGSLCISRSPLVRDPYEVRPSPLAALTTLTTPWPGAARVRGPVPRQRGRGRGAVRQDRAGAGLPGGALQRGAAARGVGHTGHQGLVRLQVAISPPCGVLPCPPVPG